MVLLRFSSGFVVVSAIHIWLSVLGAGGERFILQGGWLPLGLGSPEKNRLTVELMRRGAAMMKEPCPTCNGVQLRYKGRVYCTSHDNLQEALLAKELSFADVAESLRNVLLVKVKDLMVALEDEKEPSRCDQMVSLLTKYVELLRKLESPGQRT